MSRDLHLQILRQVKLFADLSEGELLHLCERFEEQSFDNHRRIYRHGDEADYFYVILQGQVAIYRDEVGRPLHLQLRLGPGNFFGETGLFGGYQRSASARTSEETRVLRIAKKELLDFLDDLPAVAIKMQIAAARRHSENVAAALDLGVRSEVRIRLDRQVSLRTTFGADVEATLENLSLGGLCLDGAPPSWHEDRELAFSIVYREQALDVIGRVSWREDSKVGIAFSSPDEDHDSRVQEMLRRLLE